MTWSKNNQACLSTWFSLRNLEQTKKTFAKAEAQPMSDLTFFNPESATATQSAAKGLARQLNNMFLNYDGAKHERNVTPARAVDAMITIMIVAEKTVADLAATVDENYRFLEEGS